MAILAPTLYLLSKATVPQIIGTSILFTIVAFILGDQWILRESNNTVATLADMGLAGFYLWVVGSQVYNWELSGIEIFLIVLLIGVVEAMYHRLLQKWDKENKAFSIRNI